SAGELRWLFPHANWPPVDQSEQVHVRWALEQIAESQVPYDAIQANSPFALEIARQLGMPLVYTIHHVREPMLSALYADHPEVQFGAISRRQRRLEASLPNAAVIHHGLVEKSYPASISHLGYVVHIGRFCRAKGTHLAIDAARRAGVPIVLAGRCH